MSLTDELNFIEKDYNQFLTHQGLKDHPAILLGFIVTVLVASEHEVPDDPIEHGRLVALLEHEKERLINVMLDIDPDN